MVWAAFLVPWALRRYDEAAHTRSIERFSTAMRILGRDDASDDTPEPAPRPSRAAARVAAQRRRRTLLVLLGLTAVVLALGAVSVVPLWLVLAPLLLVAAFLVACRGQVRHEVDVWWTSQTRSPAARSTTHPRAVRPASRAESSYGGLRRPVGDEPDDEPTVVLSADALVEGQAVAVPVTTSDGTSLWDPLPVTLPTYVSKPRASRTVRNIDLGEPDSWTSGHVAGEQTTMPKAKPEPAKEQRAVGS